jgi:C-terminal peptidase prc
MKKFLTITGFLFCAISIFTGVSAFRDVAPNSPIYSAVQNLVDRNIMKDGSFFRASEKVTASLFWEIVIRETGFDPVSADFDTPLPPNIKEDDKLAPFLQEAIRRGLLNEKHPFEKDKLISKIEAIKILVKTHGILVSDEVSSAFLKKVSGVSDSTKFLPELEAAYASKILENSDVHPIRPYLPLTRKELALWIWRFDDHGEKKSSIGDDESLNNKSIRNRNTTTERQLKTTPKKRITIQVIPMNSSTTTNSFNTILPNAHILEAIYQEIESRYKFSETLTADKKRGMMDAAIVAMVKAVGDKYSSYIEPAKAKEFKDDLNGKFEGIGAYVEMVDGKFTITAPIKGSPAEAAGMLPGDIVTAVDGKSIEGMSINDSIDLVKGEAGTLVKLTVLREGIGTKEIVVKRGKIIIPSVTIEWKNSIPVIGIHQFAKDTKSKLETILKEEVLTKKPRGIVFDFRNNPGGFLTSAVDIGEYFSSTRDLIFSVEYKNGKQEYRSSRDGELKDQKNIVVLQNPGTASASEIVIAMLQDTGLAKVIGTKSLGKGTVQEISNYNNGGILKLTIAKWLSPKGRWIHEKGIIPDIEISDPTPEEKKQKLDRQLDRAVRAILDGR